MTQTNVGGGAPGYARFCTACGGPLPGPVPRCPRCGAEITAVGKAKRSRSATIIIIVAVAVFGAVPCLGILAAIAIPNFIRYQLRAKEASVKAELAGLVKAEQAVAMREGHYVALGPLPASPPNSQKQPLSAEDQQVATGLDWMVGPSTYGRFRVAVAQNGSGQQAVALCAETDLDGDGTLAVHVAFLPVPAGAPPAPCTSPVPYDRQYQAGEVIVISAPNVF